MTPNIDAVRALVAQVSDPEIPVLTIDDLGILRDVRVDGAGGVEVDITPTYSGCPALDVIREDIEATLNEHGFAAVTVRIVLAPAWTTDWMSAAGRDKLRAYGIAPPGPVTSRGSGVVPPAVVCPQCHSAHTTEVSRFAATPCQALHRCAACREPFPHFKAH